MLLFDTVVPVDAQVYINDKLTRTEGEKRSYVSRNLKSDRDYHYNVKAVVVRGGKEIVRTQLVTLQTGSDQTVAFDFQATPMTSLAIDVPADAEVKLCGKPTAATGSLRHYATDRLEEGTTWKDYTVLVSVTRNGKVVSQEKKLDMVAGETYSLNFEFDSANEKIASK